MRKQLLGWVQVFCWAFWGLQNVSAQNASLQNTDLQNAVSQKADLQNASLQNTVSQNASLQNTNDASCPLPLTPIEKKAYHRQLANMRRHMRQSLKAHQKALSYADWQRHPLNPQHWLQQFDACVVCEVVRSLPPIELNIFYKALASWATSSPDSGSDSNPDSGPASCMQGVVNQHRGYMQKARKGLRDRGTLKKSRDQKPPAQGEPPSKKKHSPPLTFVPFGPSQAIELDARKTPFVVDQYLGEKELVLSFDDGPHSYLTTQLLQDLREHQVVSHFFVVGRQSLQNPEVLQSIHEQGHIVGTHSQSHKLLTRLTLPEAQDEICEGFASALQVLDFTAPFFRFPYGAFNTSLKNFVQQNNWANFFWRIDTLDWKYKDPDYLLSYVLQQIEAAGRGMVLMHDIQPQTIIILPRLLLELAHRGYKSFFYRPTYNLRNDSHCVRKP